MFWATIYAGSILSLYLSSGILCVVADFKQTMRRNGFQKAAVANNTNSSTPIPAEQINNANIVDQKKKTVLNDADGSSSTTTSTCRINKRNGKASSCNNAVVLYQPELNTPLKRFQIPIRTFEFAGQKLTIQQKWDDHGVAAVVWDSAVVLCEFLEQEKHLVKNKNIIELGSGTGLVGLVATYLGGNVTVTERQSVLDYLHSIIKENINQDNEKAQIRVSKLDWTDDLRHSFSPEYDLILGADIIYIEETFLDLQRTLLYLSNRQNCTILLSCKIRYKKDSNFLEMMKNSFAVEQLLYDAERDISIFRIKKKNIDPL